MGEPSIDSLHDVYEEQLSAARFKAERDAAVQELQDLRKGADYLEDMYHEAFAELLSETAKAKRLGHLVWRLQNRLARAHRRERALRKGMRMWREKVMVAPVRTVSAYDLLPEDDLQALRWVREHGGLDSVKKLLDWVVGHCSTKQQLDFDFWLSGRVMHELGFEGDMADRDEVERRLLARLMPDGYEWPTVDGKPVDFVTGYEPSIGVLEAVSIYSNGACEVMSHDGIIKPVSEIHVVVPAADGRPLREGEHVWHVETGAELVVKGLPKPGEYQAVVVFALPTSPASHLTSFDPDQLTHQRPVLDACGVPTKVGDTVYEVEGTGHAYKVVGIRAGDGDPLPPTVVTCDVGDGTSEHFLPSQLTHTKPEPDSWSSVWADVSNGNESPEGMMRRCRALAERGE